MFFPEVLGLHYYPLKCGEASPHFKGLVVFSERRRARRALRRFSAATNAGGLAPTVTLLPMPTPLPHVAPARHTHSQRSPPPQPAAQSHQLPSGPASALVSRRTQHGPAREDCTPLHIHAVAAAPVGTARGPSCASTPISSLTLSARLLPGCCQVGMTASSSELDVVSEDDADVEMPGARCTHASPHANP